MKVSRFPRQEKKRPLANINTSRNQINLPHNGLRWTGHRPRKPNNGNRLPLQHPRPRNPTTSLRRNHESLSKRRRMGEMSCGGKSSICLCSSEGDPPLLDRHPDLSPQSQHQRYPLGRSSYSCRNNFLYGTYLHPLYRPLIAIPLLTAARMPTPPTTTQPTSPTHSPSTQTATSTPGMAPEPLTTPTAPAPACAQALTSQTANSSPHSSG